MYMGVNKVYMEVYKVYIRCIWVYIRCMWEYIRCIWVYIRFCNGAKLHRADLLSYESHIGLVFTLYRIAVAQA